MKWILYLFVHYFYFNNSFKNNFKKNFINNELTIKKNKKLYPYEGVDQRNTSFEEKSIDINEIRTNLIKKEILDILLSDKVSIYTKINIIEKYDILDEYKNNDIMKYFD